jgi:hypothetical protein
MSDTPSTWRRGLGPLVKLAVSAGLLGILLSRTDVAALAGRFLRMDPAWAAAALAAYGAVILVSAWRWRLLLRVQAAEVGTWTLTESFLVATFFNNFLLSNIGGDVVRIADTAPYTGSKTLATTVVLVDRSSPSSSPGSTSASTPPWRSRSAARGSSCCSRCRAGHCSCYASTAVKLPPLAADTWARPRID